MKTFLFPFQEKHDIFIAFTLWSIFASKTKILGTNVHYLFAHWQPWYYYQKLRATLATKLHTKCVSNMVILPCLNVYHSFFLLPILYLFLCFNNWSYIEMDFVFLWHGDKFQEPLHEQLIQYVFCCFMSCGWWNFILFSISKADSYWFERSNAFNIHGKHDMDKNMLQKRSHVSWPTSNHDMNCCSAQL